MRPTARNRPPISPAVARDRRLTRRDAIGRLAAGGSALALASAGFGQAGFLAVAQDVAPPAAGATPAAADPAFVLVHGTFFGGAGWAQVGSLLEGMGHTVAAPDLPAHGDDRTPIPEVSLSSYVDRVLASVDAATAPVVLVGHSMGGIVITEVAERRPDKVGTLVYLAAYLPEGGRSLFDLATTDTESDLAPRLVIDEANGVMEVAEEDFVETFLHDVPAAAAARAAAGLRPEPLAPLVTPVRTTRANFGRVRRVYVATLADRVVSPGLQERMIATLPVEAVFTMETGHLPHLADPDGLAAILTSMSLEAGSSANTPTWGR